MTYIALAAILFVGTHLGISSTGLRSRLVATLGERGYLVLYSLIAIGTLSYLIWLYNELPRYDYFWLPSPELHSLAKVVCPHSGAGRFSRQKSHHGGRGASARRRSR